VRSREGYVAPLKNEKLPEPSRIAELSPALSNALANPLSDVRVPIRLSASAYRADRKNALVTVVAEIDPAELGLVERNGTFTGPLEVGFLATNVTGKVFQGQHYIADLNLKRQTYFTARDQGLRVLSEIHLPPDRYQIRFAAGSPSGSAGSVVYDLAVPDFTSGGFTLSGLTLTSASTQTVTTVAPNDPLRQWLPRPATARRTFDSTDTIAVFGEVYGGAAAVKADAIGIGVELLGPDGYAVRTASAHGDRFTVALPLANLDPGTYVLHVEAQTTAGKPEHSSRDIPIRVIAR
jgi:hypothetical protein